MHLNVIKRGSNSNVGGSNGNLVTCNSSRSNSSSSSSSGGSNNSSSSNSSGNENATDNNKDSNDNGAEKASIPDGPTESDSEESDSDCDDDRARRGVMVVSCVDGDRIVLTRRKIIPTTVDDSEEQEKGGSNDNNSDLNYDDCEVVCGEIVLSGNYDRLYSEDEDDKPHSNKHDDNGEEICRKIGGKQRVDNDDNDSLVVDVQETVNNTTDRKKCSNATATEKIVIASDDSHNVKENDGEISSSHVINSDKYQSDDEYDEKHNNNGESESEDNNEKRGSIEISNNEIRQSYGVLRYGHCDQKTLKKSTDFESRKRTGSVLKSGNPRENNAETKGRMQRKENTEINEDSVDQELLSDDEKEDSQEECNLHRSEQEANEREEGQETEAEENEEFQADNGREDPDDDSQVHEVECQYIEEECQDESEKFHNEDDCQSDSEECHDEDEEECQDENEKCHNEDDCQSDNEGQEEGECQDDEEECQKDEEERHVDKRDCQDSEIEFEDDEDSQYRVECKDNEEIQSGIDYENESEHSCQLQCQDDEDEDLDQNLGNEDAKESQIECSEIEKSEVEEQMSEEEEDCQIGICKGCPLMKKDVKDNKYMKENTQYTGGSEMENDETKMKNYIEVSFEDVHLDATQSMETTNEEVTINDLSIKTKVKSSSICKGNSDIDDHPNSLLENESDDCLKQEAEELSRDSSLVHLSTDISTDQVDGKFTTGKLPSSASIISTSSRDISLTASNYIPNDRCSSGGAGRLDSVSLSRPPSALSGRIGSSLVSRPQSPDRCRLDSTSSSDPPSSHSEPIAGVKDLFRWANTINAEEFKWTCSVDESSVGDLEVDKDLQEEEDVDEGYTEDDETYEFC